MSLSFIVKLLAVVLSVEMPPLTCLKTDWWPSWTSFMSQFTCSTEIYIQIKKGSKAVQNSSLQNCICIDRRLWPETDIWTPVLVSLASSSMNLLRPKRLTRTLWVFWCWALSPFPPYLTEKQVSKAVLVNKEGKTYGKTSRWLGRFHLEETSQMVRSSFQEREWSCSILFSPGKSATGLQRSCVEAFVGYCWFDCPDVKTLVRDWSMKAIWHT